MADSLIRTGASKYVADHRRRAAHRPDRHHDRSTAFIFADGAGAAVIGPSDVPAIGPVVWGSDGEQADLITQTQPWDRAIARPSAPHWPVLQMNGNPVFKWASVHHGQDRGRGAGRRRRPARGPRRLRAAPGQQPDHRRDVRALKLPGDVVVARDIVHQGNTSAASIPLAIETLLASGEAKSGQTA